MFRILSVQTCIQKDENGELMLRFDDNVEREKIQFLRTEKQFLALTSRLISWRECGKVSPVITTVVSEDDETGEICICSYDYAEEIIREHI